MKRIVPIALALIPVQAASAADVVRFVTCPIYRDTDAGRKSGCWLADDHGSGIRYDVSWSPTKPDWNFEILVEGTRSATHDEACGGVTLDPVRVSVLEGRCPRHMLPAENHPGRRFVLPARNVRPLSEAREAPQPPFGDRSFQLYFDFGKSFLIYQYSDFLLDEAITWLRAAKPRRIVITGYADTKPVEVSGRTFAERPEVARQRAELAAEALKRLGIDPAILTVEWRSDAPGTDDPGADGIPGQARRRVEIRAITG